MSNVAQLNDHPRRKALTANLRAALAPGQLESEARNRIARAHEEKVGLYRSQIRYYATRLAEIEGENAADEWLTRCMSRGVK